jgi:hypothetical protein
MNVQVLLRTLYKRRHLRSSNSRKPIDRYEPKRAIVCCTNFNISAEEMQSQQFDVNIHTCFFLYKLFWIGTDEI